MDNNNAVFKVEIDDLEEINKAILELEQGYTTDEATKITSIEQAKLSKKGWLVWGGL